MIVSGLGIFAAVRFVQSEGFRIKADEQLKQGHAEEAILLYTKAQAAFPLRRDVQNDIEGARLILESDLNYIQFYSIGAQIQAQPPISELPVKRSLKAGELFVPILMYHHIGVNPKPGDPVWAALYITPESLENEFTYLDSHNFHVITLDELYSALSQGQSLPENPVVLTFDDGYRSFFDSAYPVLKKHNMKAIDFVITGAVGASAYLTWDEILQMDKSGLIQFGAHTRHHPNLPDLSQSLITEEIKGSKADLESHLGKKIDWFAYPYGSYNNFAISVVKDAGFKGAVSTIYSNIQTKDSLFLLPRIMANGMYGLDNFIMRVSR